MFINQSRYNLGSELFQAHNQMCSWQSFGCFFAITLVIAPDYSSNGLHYNLKEHATRDAILGQKSDIIKGNSPKRNQNPKTPQHHLHQWAQKIAIPKVPPKTSIIIHQQGHHSCHHDHHQAGGERERRIGTSWFAMHGCPFPLFSVSAGLKHPPWLVRK